jgi:hypothetical protein
MLVLAVTADRGPVNPERYLAASQAPEDSQRRHPSAPFVSITLVITRAGVT